MAAAGPPPTGELEDSTSRQATDEYYAEDTDGEGRIDASHLNSMRDKEKKIGHRRVDKSGIVSYKKKPTSELMAAIQLGIGQSVGGLSSKPERDVLMQDFGVVEVVFFPGEGSNLTPAHHYSDFRFKTYAPVAFRYFRDLFGIQPEDFMLSLCNEPLKELSNPGASGSIFYLTHDDEFIIKTVQHKEADFLQKLLPGYFLNISQNKRTLLPKFYGLYCYQCGGKNIRFTVMNNLLPSTVQLHEKYDMKGSTYKRKASKSERAKRAPTLKDLDFIEIHPECLQLEKDIYDSLIKTLQRDCRVLESFKIMDYSLLVGIYNLDQVSKDNRGLPADHEVVTDSTAAPTYGLHRAKSMRTRIGQYSTPLESIQGNTDLRDELEEDEDVPPGGIPARNAKGERILLYLGIIDILQSFRLKKRLEHTVKSMVIDGDTISVHRPSYYAQRFLQYHATRVFRKVSTALKHSPSKRRALNKSTKQTPGQSDVPEQHSIIHSNPRSSRTISFSDEQTVTADEVGGKPPDLLPEYSKSSAKRSPRLQHDRGNANINGNSAQQKRSDAFSMSTYPSEDALSAGTASTASLRAIGMGSGYPSSSGRGPSPPLSLSESTPTHTDFTEGTPSFTNSSPSCSSDVMDMGGVSPMSPLEAMDSPGMSYHHHHHHHRSPDLHQHHRGRMVHSGKAAAAASGRSPTNLGTATTGADKPSDASPSHHPSPSKQQTAEVTVMVIPESPPPPFEAVVGEEGVRAYPPQTQKQVFAPTAVSADDDVSAASASVSGSSSTVTTTTTVKSTQEVIVSNTTTAITKKDDGEQKEKEEEEKGLTQVPAVPAIINAAGSAVVADAEEADAAADEDEM